MNKARIARQFGRAARSYAKASEIQRKAGEALLNLLPKDFAPRGVLDLGCGDGEHSAGMRARWPQCALTAVDLAEGMLAAAKANTGLQNATFLQEDMDDPAWWATDRWDLVYSNMALQWSADGAAVAARVRESLRAGGYFALGAFLEGTCQELVSVFGACGVRLLPRPGFRAGATLLDWIASARLSQVFCAEHREVERFPALLPLLGKLRDLGAITGMEGHLTPGLVRKLETRWKELFPDPLGLPLTWHFGLYLSRRLLP
ncbi:MAG: methyltransferase domain-containing protein [Spirochaetes bacterium]|nr:methyltransferase domain-containing protein [Spirochaetota bacterium]